MTAIRQLEIRRIYSADPVRAREAVSVAPAPAARTAVLGLLALLMAGAWIYAAWFPADRFMLAALFKTRLNRPGGLGELFKAAPPDLADPSPPEGSDEDEAAPEEDGPLGPVGPTEAEMEAETNRILTHLWGDMAVWLAVMTIAACHLAWAGGAAAGAQVRAGPNRLPMLLAAVLAMLMAAYAGRIMWTGDALLFLTPRLAEVMMVLTLMAGLWLMVAGAPSWLSSLLGACAIGLVLVFAWWVWQQFERGYPAEAPRLAAVAAVAIAALLGTLSRRRAALLLRRSAWVLAAAAVLTVAAIKYGDHLGGFQNKPPASSTYATIVVAQLACAGVALLSSIASRARQAAPAG